MRSPRSSPRLQRLRQDPAGGFELIELSQHPGERQYLLVDAQPTEIRVAHAVEKPGCGRCCVLGQLG